MKTLRAIWGRADLPQNNWPDEDVETLTKLGIPESNPGLTMEFGVFNSPDGVLILGEDPYAPEPSYVFVSGQAREVWYGSPFEHVNHYVNASVTMLRRVMEALWDDVPVAQIMKFDSTMNLHPKSIWPPILERFDAIEPR